MATITVRNLDSEVQRRIKKRAAAHNRSMEAEARAILIGAVVGADLPQAWIDATAEFRGDDLDIPARSVPRELDLS